jgi:hypothetical protein
MWEARANPETFAHLLTWVCETAVPELEEQPQHVSSEVFSSADYRIVVISRWNGTPDTPAELPRRLVTRSPHSWDFVPVQR